MHHGVANGRLSTSTAKSLLDRQERVRRPDVLKCSAKFGRAGFKEEVLGDIIHIVLSERVTFRDIGVPCQVYAELVTATKGIAKGRAFLINLGVTIPTHINVTKIATDSVFLQDNGFVDLLKSRDLRRRAGEYKILTEIEIGYGEIGSPRAPIKHFGFDVKFTLKKTLKTTAQLTIDYRAYSGLDGVTNILTGEKESATGRLLQRFPKMIEGFEDEPVSGPRRANLFIYCASAINGPIEKTSTKPR